MSPQPTRRPVRAAASLLAVLGLSLGLVACSGDSDDSAEVVSEGSASTTEAAGGDESTTTEGSDDTTTTEGSDDEPTTTEGGGEASGDLESVLLTVDDLPAGHTQGEQDPDDSTMSDDEPLCEGTPEASFPDPVEEAGRDFQTEDFSSLVGSFAARYDGDGAEQALDWFLSELERCGGASEDDLAYEYRELSGIGDGALEMSLYDAEDPSSGAAFVYFAQVDDVLVGVSVFADGSVDIDGEALIALSASRV